MKLDKRIILVAKAGGGKDFFKDYLVSEGFVPSVSHTTRPMRDGEVEGETYNYVCDTVFNLMIEQGEFHENKSFNGWSYGTTSKSFNNSGVFIFTPSGIASLSDEEKMGSIIVYIDIDKDVRLARLSRRSDSDTIMRRMTADAEDFRHFKEWDIRVTNSEFNCEELLNTIISLSNV